MAVTGQAAVIHAPAIQRQTSISIKPAPTPAAAPSPTDAASPAMSLTSREWVIPPRPKPGRKPATDTPPTKRKAQNRAAQRAFRERRAARVGELEEHMKQIEEEHEQEQESLNSHITELEQSLQRCQSDLTTWMNKCRQLEAELAVIRQQQHPSSEQQSSTVQVENQVVSTDTMQISQGDETIGCGKCTLDSRCQCIDDVVEAMGGDTNIPLEKRSHSPDTSSNKRVKIEPVEQNIMEIDFTAAFSKPNARQSRPQTVIIDPCGFCQDGTPCICAEMAAEQERSNATGANSPTALMRPNIRQLAQFTPPPSEGDVAATFVAAQSRCSGVPGSCAQCRVDPNSTLFCKSLAASRAHGGSANGCCGDRGRNDGCCQSSVPLPPRQTRARATTNVNVQPPSQSQSVLLSCADAYTALSRHTAYNQASSEMASWMPKLHAHSVGVEGRHPLEIDAANVMAVLREFDCRFGADR